MFKNFFGHPTSQEVAVQNLEAERLALLRSSAELAYCQAMVTCHAANIARLEAVVEFDRQQQRKQQLEHDKASIPPRTGSN